MSIRVHSVSKTFGRQKALDNVSFSVESGQITGFLGPNGAGKSTMMKIITGYLQADSGLVEIDGRRMGEDSIDLRRRIGYLPEHNPLYLDMYVREYLEMVAGIYGIGSRRKAVGRTMELTGLLPEGHKKIGALSKGYRQRVGLAQALLPDPSILILDEPTTGLDPNQIIEIRELIRHVGQQKTVMLSTHIMQEVEAVCGSVVIIDRGTVKAGGRTDEVARMLTGRTTVEVAFSRNPDTRTLAAALAQADITADGGIISISTDPDVDVRPQLFAFAVQHGLTLTHLVKKGGHMEDVFHALTSQGARADGQS